MTPRSCRNPRGRFASVKRLACLCCRYGGCRDLEILMPETWAPAAPSAKLFFREPTIGVNTNAGTPTLGYTSVISALHST
jgi:hypothetical protein